MSQWSKFSHSDSRHRLILDSSTSLELLESIKNQSSDSWPVFVQKYTRLLLRWCEEWKASKEDTEDVLQETLLELFRKINDYQVKPETTFRSWLRKVAYFRYLKIVRKNRRLQAGEGFGEGHGQRVHDSLETVQICESFMKLIEVIADQELLEIACRRIARRVDSKHWEIFIRRELGDESSKEVAEAFGISVNAVDVITFRVRRMVRAELEMLDPPDRT